MSRIETKKKQIGKNLKQKRKSGNHSFYAIRKHTGLIDQQVKQIESGTGQPTLDSVLKLAFFYDCVEGLI